ncbi:MAG: DUF4244 domain-containing protein [Acidimicrobiia bacterium]|nr:DUF4244 domain-containing protein [Acidimicrobiia bacterium]
MLSLYVAIQTACVACARAAVNHVRWRSRNRLGSASGQATAEYALVLLGAAAIALLLAAWAAKSGKIGQLFDAVVGQLIDETG